MINPIKDDKPNPSIWTKKYKSITGKRAFILFLIFLGYMILFHLPVFPFIYLSDQREKDIVEFSEILLSRFDSDFALHRDQSLSKFPGEENHMDIIIAAQWFAKANDFQIIQVHACGDGVTYRRSFLIFFGVDYKYRTHSRKTGESRIIDIRKPGYSISTHFRPGR